ncbi:MAG: phage tail length tape measure family protein [Rhizobiaceae bacterium]|nr:phage tail length tape measure family protein [Rhizobiaceae bacterium]
MTAIAEAKRRLTIEARSSGLKEVATELRQIDSAQKAVTVSGRGMERATQSTESAFGRLQRRYDEAYRSQIERARAERVLAQAQAQGLVTAERHAELSSMIATRHSTAAAAIDKQAAATNRLAAANDNAWRRRNLAFQAVDVGQSLALGMNPGLIAAQQGGQIGQLYAGAGGMRTALGDVANLASVVVKRFGPIGVAAGIAAGGILALQADIQETTGIAVSFGDVLKGAIQAAGDAVYQFLKPAIDTIAPIMASAWQMILDGAKAVGNALIAGWVVQVEAFRRIWSDLPAILGDLGVQAVNALIGAFEDGYAVLVPKIKEFYRLLNPVAALADATGNSAIANALGTGMLPNDITIGEITNKWAGAAGSAAADVANAAREAFARDFIGEAYDAALNDISGRAIDNYKKRMAEAEESAKKTGKAARDALDPWKGMRNLTEGGREWERWQQDQIRAAEDAKEAWQQVGSVLSGIFSQPFTDASDMLDRMLSQAGQIGSALQQAFEKAGKATGNPALAAAGGKIGAAFGGFGAGYQSQNPLMGGIGGALSGFVSTGGNPIGALVGAGAGRLGGIFTRKALA